jgi:segregation and condensation protein B
MPEPRPVRLISVSRRQLVGADISCLDFSCGANLRGMQNDERASHSSAKPPLSLSRLRDAFAAMLGDGNQNSPAENDAGTSKQAAKPVHCEICPRSVVEAVLFVGRPDNRPISARELAAAMRGVSPAEIDEAVVKLNSIYDSDGAPYRIEQSNAGYRLALRNEFERVRDKFYGKVKEARLSPAMLEVLSVLAYNQPATMESLNELRGAPCGSALSMLVRRRLVKMERPAEGNAVPHYSTTERFLRLFGLENLEALPRAEELERA